MRLVGGHLKPAAVMLALGFVGCDSSQFVLVSLQGLLTTGTVTVRATYTLDTNMAKNGIARVTPPVDQFAVMFPGETRGNFTTNVRAFTYVSPTECYKADGSASVMLDGSHKQELTVGMQKASMIPCDATQAPVTLPATDGAPLASWGNAANNIWVVGDKGMILRWNGSSFLPVGLPPELAANPPTWRAVAGAGTNYVWFAGDKGVIARWDGTTVTTVPLQSGGPAAPNWVSLSVANAMNDEVFFASREGVIGHNVTGMTGVQAMATVNTTAAYPVMTNPVMMPMSKTVSFSDVYCNNPNECWFVGYDSGSFASGGQTGAGYVLLAYSYFSPFMYYDYSMSDVTPTIPLSRSRLHGVWGNFTTAGFTITRHLYMVGEDATLLVSNNSILAAAEPNAYPKFKSDYSPTAATALQGRSQKLNAIGGTGATDLWVAGDGGLLMRWDTTPVPSGNPFTLVNTGVTANLGSVFSTGPEGRVYVSGDQQTFISP